MQRVYENAFTTTTDTRVSVRRLIQRERERERVRLGAPVLTACTAVIFSIGDERPEAGLDRVEDVREASPNVPTKVAHRWF